ncbi:MAG TPA: AI-2E family transporter [Chryseosolibacter sp.]|nr:AI-2E family transporter [Chryseosolibacter sp.]
MTDAERSPFYLRFGLTIVTLALLAVALYLGKAILLPFFFSVLLATLLLPVINKLQLWRFGKIPSITITLLVALILIGAVIYFLSAQIGSFFDDFPTLEKRFRTLVWEGQQWVYDNFHIGYKQQQEYIDETAEKMTTNQGLLSRTVLTLTGVISYIIFLPVYTFLILYHKDMIKKFLISIFANDDEDKVREVLQESQLMSHQYLTGLLIQVSIVFTLNTIGFFFLDIKYAVFLGFLSALLNIVPYIGMLIANVIAITITLVSSPNPIDAVWASGVLMSVQVIDNNFLMPMIVGNKVKLNALAIILGVLIAGALCGVAGMFLAIPALAALKLIFERVPNLKPWAMLLGDETTIEQERKNPVKTIFDRVKSKVKKTKSKATSSR